MRHAALPESAIYVDCFQAPCVTRHDAIEHVGQASSAIAAAVSALWAFKDRGVELTEKGCRSWVSDHIVEEK